MKSLFAKFFPRTEPGIADLAIPAECLRALRDDDQFIVSYPRSGNRWLRVMVRDVIVLNRPDLPPPADLRTLVPDLHHFEPDAAALAQFGVRSRILKSHNLRAIAGRRWVYIFRRAADALISFYHFRQKQPLWAEKTKSLTADEFCVEMLPGWVEHMELAIRQREEFADRTCFVAYEALHASAAVTLRTTLDFLGIAASDDVIRGAIEGNAFEKNRAQVAAKPTDGPTPILRKGRVGTAAEELRPGSLAQIEAAALPLYQRANELAAVRA